MLICFQGGFVRTLPDYGCGKYIPGRSNHESCLQDARSNPQLFLGLEKKGGSSKSGIVEEGSKEDRRDQRKKKQASEYIPWTRPACLVLLSIPVDMV